MAGAGMYGELAGASANVFSTYNKAKSQQASYAYMAAIARRNAQIAQYQASDAIRTGQIEEGNFDLKAAAMLSDQRASMAANGVDLGEGSPNDVLTTTKFMGERDALQIHDNAMKAAWGYETQANNFLTDADAYSAQKKAISPGWEAAGSLLTGASNVSSSWTAENASTGKYKNADGSSMTAGQKLSGYFK